MPRNLISVRSWPMVTYASILCAAVGGALAVISRAPAMTATPSAIKSQDSRSAPSFNGVANVRSAQFGAKGDGRTDDTAAIQAAIDAAVRVYIPAGVYRINPRIGLVLRPGTQLVGDGRSNTLLLAAPGGGSIRQLAGYGPGSILRRRFNPNNANPYVAYIYLADFSVIMTHPRTSITNDDIQIGIDFRNITRSVIERVHVGNSLPIGTAINRAPAHVFDSQGYGIVLGSVPSSLPAYAGGELNVVRDTSVWGAYKAIVQDDQILSPRSAAHATVIEHADLQGAQMLLSQESEYARGTVWRDNILQNVVPQPGGNDQATVMHIDGQDIQVEGGYVEAGGLGRYLVYLGPLTKHVSITLLHSSCTNELINLNRGAQNSIVAGEDCRIVDRHDP